MDNIFPPNKRVGQKEKCSKFVTKNAIKIPEQNNKTTYYAHKIQELLKDISKLGISC